LIKSLTSNKTPWPWNKATKMYLPLSNTQYYFLFSEKISEFSRQKGTDGRKDGRRSLYLKIKRTLWMSVTSPGKRQSEGGPGSPQQ
jgi:hypothetical protein